MLYSCPSPSGGWQGQSKSLAPTTSARLRVSRWLLPPLTVEQQLQQRGLLLQARARNGRQPLAKAEAASCSVAGPSTAPAVTTPAAGLQWRCGRLTAVQCGHRHPVPSRAVAAPWQRRRRAASLATAASVEALSVPAASANCCHHEAPATSSQAPAAVIDAAVAASPPPQAGDGSPQPLQANAPAGQPPPTPSNVIRYSARCLSGHAAIEQFFPTEVAAARSSTAGQRVRLHLRSSTDGQIHPYDVRIMPVYGRDKPCRLHGVSLLTRDAGLQPGDTAELQRLPDGRVVLQPVARAAGTHQRRITAPEPVVVREYELKSGVINIPLPTVRLLLGSDMAARSRAGTDVPVRVEDDGRGAATEVYGGEGTGAADPEQALGMSLRSYNIKGNRCSRWLLSGLGTLQARGALAAGTQLFLAAERRSSGVAAEHGVEGASCADPTLIVNVGRPFRDGPETAVPAGVLPCAGAVEESAGRGLGAGAGSSRVDGGATCGLPADDGAPAVECGTLTLSSGVFLGMSTLRFAFPDEVLQAQQSRTPQPVTLYARNQDGSLGTYAAVISPRFNPSFLCNMSRIGALVGDLGLRQGDSVELLRRGAGAHCRVVVEVESAADPNTLRLTRSNLRQGKVIVPGRVASRLLGRSVAAQGAEEPGFPVRLQTPYGKGEAGVTGSAKPRMHSELAPGRARYQWQVAGLRPWFLSLGAAPGDQVRLEAVPCSEDSCASSSTDQAQHQQVDIAVTLLRAQGGAAGGGAEPAGAATIDAAAAPAAAARRGPMLHARLEADAAHTGPSKRTGIAQEGGDAAGGPVHRTSDSDGEASCGTCPLTVDSSGARLVGIAALRAAFPEQLAAALRTRDPQIVTVYGRLLGGKLRPYSVAVRAYGRNYTLCRLARCSALISDLGLRTGDQVSLSVLPDGRYVLESVSNSTSCG